MPASDLPRIDRNDLVDYLGEVTVERGIDYARRGNVTNGRWQQESAALVGSVRNGRGQIYRTVAYFEPDDDGTLTFYGGDCNCPMGINCKHVAALCWAFADGRLGVKPPPPPAVPKWRTSLDNLLPVLDGGGQPLAIEFSLNPDSVTARLLKPGTNKKWIAGDLSWSTIDTMWRTSEFQPVHLRVVRNLYALHKTATQQSYFYGYGDAKRIPISGIDSPQLWPLLAEARQVGIELLHDGAELPPVTTAQCAIDVVQSADESLTATPTITADGHPITRPVFIGNHGIAWPEEGTLRLAQLDREVPPQLQRMLALRETLAVPAEDVTQFNANYLPRLQRIATVSSSDESFEPQPITGPVLELRVAHQPGHRMALEWDWHYRMGETPLRHRVSAIPDPTGYRDLDAERAVAESVTALTGEPRLRDQQLTGMATLSFVTEVLPKLRELPGVVVSVTGELVEYRETDDVVIAVSTAESDGGTDWFDLGVTISADGNSVAFVDVFTAIAAGESHLILPNGSYFALDKPEFGRLRDLITEARAIGESDRGKIRISRFQAGLFEELAALGVVSQQAQAWQEQVAALRSLTSIEPTSPPATLQAELRHYQGDGFSWLATLHRHGLGGILADDMGLGKTIQSLAFMLHVREAAPDPPPFLVVAPSSVVSNWESEAHRFAPSIPLVTITDTLRKSGAHLPDLIAGAGLVVTSYTLFRLDFDAHAQQRWSGLFLDEAQMVKNRRSSTYQCARKLAAPLKVAITGTPMENNLMELWSLLSITAPGLFPDPKRFEDHYAKPIEKGGNRELLATFRRRIRPLVLRRTKELVAKELPEKQEQVLEVELAPKHRTIYDRRLQRERQQILGMLDDMRRNRFSILTSLTVLRQMALHPALVEEQYAAVAAAKIDVLCEQLDDVIAGGHKALVFSQFTGFLGQVRKRLDHNGIEYSYLDGRTRKRADVIEKFRTGTAPVFLISLKAGGFGLNLTEADYVFLLDPWWNPATEAQAIDRTHRIGQTRNVMVYRLIAKNTIEDKVMALNQRKAKLFASVIDDGDAFASALTAEDVRSLIE